MALHLNFYHEIHREATQRARDPRKLASLGALVLAILMAGWYLYRSSAVNAAERKAGALAAEWKQLEPKQAAAKAEEPLLQEKVKLNAALVEEVQNRFYWAPMLERVAAAVPPNVQILSFSGNFDAAPSGEKPRQVNILLAGLAAGEIPRASAESFRTGLRESLGGHYSEVEAVFDANSLEETRESIMLNGQTLPVAKFRIRLTLNPAAPAPQKPGAAVTPKPAAR